MRTFDTDERGQELNCEGDLGEVLVGSATFPHGFADSRILTEHGKRIIGRDFESGGPVRNQIKDLDNALAADFELANELALIGLDEIKTGGSTRNVERDLLFRLGKLHENYVCELTENSPEKKQAQSPIPDIIH